VGSDDSGAAFNDENCDTRCSARKPLNHKIGDENQSARLETATSITIAQLRTDSVSM
jgi:hypothetical protein